MKVKMLVMDVDGTLTDGHIYMGPQGEPMKVFSCKDGLGIKEMLPKLGVMPVIITGRDSVITANRAKELRIEQLYQGVADKLPLGPPFLLGHVAEQGGGRNRPSILADAVESVIAASFLDGGMEAARKFIEQFILCNVPVRELHNADYKTALQELVQQKKNQVLHYVLTGQSGPDHDKTFQVQVLLNDRVIGQGSGTSKKRAEQDAARNALEHL